jgi:CHAD domain-containing protein
MLRLVLRAQLKAMCALRTRALNWDDLKGVHDMRVLSRRLRSAISDLKPYLGSSSLPRLKLRAIARSLGEVRDEDVALSALEELKFKASNQVTHGIEMFAQERCRRREKTRAALKRVISRSAIKEFRKEFLTKVSAIAIAVRSNSPNEG